MAFFSCRKSGAVYVYYHSIEKRGLVALSRKETKSLDGEPVRSSLSG